MYNKKIYIATWLNLFFLLTCIPYLCLAQTLNSCDTATVGSRTNLGLYSGKCMDLTFSPLTNRLFASVLAPASLFYSDDTAKTWKAAFPVDSLEYNCGAQGWGGSARRVLANNVGWVAAYTEESMGSLSATVISFENGDSGTWKTAMDERSMQILGYNQQFTRGITLTNYYMYSILRTAIVMQDTSGINNIVDISQSISGLSSQSGIVSIASANNSSGYPYYIVVDTTGDQHQAYGKLYQYDGSNFSQISLPSSISSNGIRAVYTPLNSTTGDTIFITTVVFSNKQVKVFRSYDGGVNWQDISWTGDKHESLLTDVEYSQGGIVLMLSGRAISKDMGDTWEALSDGNYIAATVSPSDTNYILASLNNGAEISTAGTTGSFSIADNVGLEAVQVNKISKTENKSIFYIATRSGLAYTTAYLDSSIENYDKWHAPYGEFPIATVSDSDGIWSVAIDPFDSLHVIAGGAEGFYVSHSGHSGFQFISTGYMSNGPYVYDIVFVTSDIVIAITNRIVDGFEWGDIFRSTDGGLNWIKVSPSDFVGGNTLALGHNSTDTVIYAGSGLKNIKAGRLWKSTDLGQNWVAINIGPTSLATTAVDSLPINDIAIDPRGVDTLYIAAGYNLDYAFVVSYDGGLTYHYTDLIDNGAFSAVAINKDNPDSSVYVANRRDVFIYNPTTDTSELILRGLPGELVPDLAHGSILVGTTTGFYGFDGEGDEDDSLTVSVFEKLVINNSITLIIYPNPVNSIATIELNIANSSTNNMQITLLDLLGRNTQTIYKGKVPTGKTIIPIDCGKLPSGTYYIRITSNNEIMNQKIMILK